MSPWYEKGVFYHIYPLGLTGAPKVNSPDASARHFEELDKWIPHIKELGCNAIYIGPLFESSSHGYDTVDYKLVDKRLGDNSDFKEFTVLCHKNDIRVVVDGVFNHTGRDFFAFRDIMERREASPYKDWYKGVNFGWQSPLNDSFSYEAWQGHFELPCLNLQNEAVRRYLFEVIRFWIDEFDIDGIRLDCANVLDFNFMKELRKETFSMKPDFWLMGEVIHGEYERWANDEMLHSVTNYELHKSIYSGLNDHNFFEIAHNVKRLEPLMSRLYTFLDNHDENRIASKLNDAANIIPAWILLFTLPGIPSIYYGDEWALKGLRTDTSDDDLRPCISISEASGRHIPLTDLIKKLAHIHTQNPEFCGGSYKELLLTNRQYAYMRQAGDSISVIIVNNDENDFHVSFRLPCPCTHAVNLLDGTGYSFNENIEYSIAGNSGAVLKLKED